MNSHNQSTRKSLLIVLNWFYFTWKSTNNNSALAHLWQQDSCCDTRAAEPALWALEVLTLVLLNCVLPAFWALPDLISLHELGSPAVVVYQRSEPWGDPLLEVLEGPVFLLADQIDHFQEHDEVVKGHDKEPALHIAYYIGLRDGNNHLDVDLEGSQ